MGRAHRITTTLVRRMQTDAPRSRAGLPHGGAGAAPSLLHTFELTGDESLRAPIGTLLRQYLARLGLPPFAEPGGTPLWRYSTSLVNGSAGVAVVLDAAAHLLDRLRTAGDRVPFLW